jgi:hypothetical protein
MLLILISKLSERLEWSLGSYKKAMFFKVKGELSTQKSFHFYLVLFHTVMEFRKSFVFCRRENFKTYTKPVCLTFLIIYCSGSCQCRSQWHCYSLILSQSPSVTLLHSYPVTVSVSDTATILSCHSLRQCHCYYLILSQSSSVTLLLSYPVTVSVSDTATILSCHSLRQWHCYYLILSQSPSVTLLHSYPVTVSISNTDTLVQLVSYPTHPPLYLGADIATSSPVPMCSKVTQLAVTMVTPNGETARPTTVNSST